MGEADDRHHRDRRHPGLFAVFARIVGRKQRRAVVAATHSVTTDLEQAAERGQPGKISVTGAARLPGLPREAGQGLRRRGEQDSKQSGECEEPGREPKVEPPPTKRKRTVLAPHRTPPIDHKTPGRAPKPRRAPGGGNRIEKCSGGARRN